MAAGWRRVAPRPIPSKRRAYERRRASPGGRCRENLLLNPNTHGCQNELMTVAGWKPHCLQQFVGRSRSAGRPAGAAGFLASPIAARDRSSGQSAPRPGTRSRSVFVWRCRPNGRSAWPGSFFERLDRACILHRVTQRFAFGDERGTPSRVSRCAEASRLFRFVCWRRLWLHPHQ
jgi:hypothetical protein